MIIIKPNCAEKRYERYQWSVKVFISATVEVKTPIFWRIINSATHNRREFSRSFESQRFLLWCLFLFDSWIPSFTIKWMHEFCMSKFWIQSHCYAESMAPVQNDPFRAVVSIGSKLSLLYIVESHWSFRDLVKTRRCSSTRDSHLRRWFMSLSQNEQED